MNGEPGQVVSADGNSVARVTVTNAAAYELPETGGTGTAGYSICGTALMVFALVMGCDRKRKQKRNGIA
jgi:LPXTG-motif cell wall-anchored protein